MTVKKIKNLALVAAMSLMALPAFGASLWNDGSGNLVNDHKAAFVGDIITINVSDSTTATQKASTTLKQEEKMESTAGTGVIGQFIEAFGIESSDEYKGNGSTSSSGSLTTTVTAEVVEVMPNGNLVIEAKKSQVVNNETQYVILSGTVRPEDITRDNVVASTKIANLNINYRGKGATASRQKQGILNKLFDILF